MNQSAVIIITLILTTTLVNCQLYQPGKSKKIAETIEWYGQASVKISHGDKNIFIDPFRVNTDATADLILITHSHGDHLSMEDIKKVATNETQFYAPESCQKKLHEAGYSKLNSVVPSERYRFEDVSFETVPAYNIIKNDKHSKESGWVGYLVTVDGVKIYHAGDTERIPEMKQVDCDIALLPLGQKYTMNSVEEAAKAAIDVKAEIAIPFHYGLYEGTKADAETFKELLKDKMKVMVKDVE